MPHLSSIELFSHLVVKNRNCNKCPQGQGYYLPHVCVHLRGAAERAVMKVLPDWDGFKTFDCTAKRLYFYKETESNKYVKQYIQTSVAMMCRPIFMERY